MKRVLQPPKNVKSMNFFTDYMKFPMVVYSTNEVEEQMLLYLKTGSHNSASLCRWCIRHNMKYQIIYPLSVREIIKNPVKYMEYRRMKKVLKEICE